MKKIVIIGVYFGKFPLNYDLWLKSTKYNPTIDFKIFTDQKLISDQKNLEYIKMTLEEFNILMQKKIGEKYIINHAYKCCDYKPVYGIILEDYIQKYDFWGHCDFDMIFGDLRKYFTEELLREYDKILPLGHLSLYRNTHSVNNRYKDDGSLCGNYDNVFSSNLNYAFDETSGIAQIYYKNNYPFYDKRIFADISIIHKRFTCAMGDRNYKYQIFYWEKGGTYRDYYENGIIKKEEFIYIHFKQRKYLTIMCDAEKCNSFYICDKGFIEKSRSTTLSDIKKYNNYRGFLNEYFELLSYRIKKIFIGIKCKLFGRGK